MTSLFVLRSPDVNISNRFFFLNIYWWYYSIKIQFYAFASTGTVTSSAPVYDKQHHKLSRIVQISCVHFDGGHPKGLNSTGNKNGPYGIHVSSPHDPPRQISHPVQEKGFQSAKQCWSPMDISRPWKIRNYPSQTASSISR